MSPITLERRVNKLEEALEKHLMESGEIRTDLKWLKKAFWVLAGGGITFNVALAGAVVAHYLHF